MTANRLGNGKTPLTNIAYEEIRKNILNGTFRPGHRLVVNDLVAEWDISNTPIKEALNRLVSEGLVDFEPRRGMRVRRQLTATEVQEKYELRALLEEHCCRRAAVNGARHPEVLARLETLLAEMEKLLVGEADALHLYRLDGEFYDVVVSLCGNSEIVRQVNLLKTEILTFGLLASQSYPLRRQVATLVEHREIVAALARGDRDASADAMHRHLHNAREHLLAFHERVSGGQSAASEK